MKKILLLLLTLPGALTAQTGAPGEDIDKVQTAYEQAVSKNPQDREALFTLGLLYEKKHMTQEALAVWRKYLSLETDPAHRAIAEKHIHRLSQ